MIISLILDKLKYINNIGANYFSSYYRNLNITSYISTLHHHFTSQCLYREKGWT